MLHAIRLVCFLALGFTLSMQIGCNKGESTSASSSMDSPTGDGHDHEHGDHSHAETFGGAIAELEGLAATIGSSMEKNDADAAHGPLHEIHHVLELIPELAQKEGLPAEQLTLINGAVETLMNSYGDLDAGMHGEQGKSWGDLKSDINAAIETLTAFEHDHDDQTHEAADHDHQ